MSPLGEARATPATPSSSPTPTLPAPSRTACATSSHRRGHRRAGDDRRLQRRPGRRGHPHRQPPAQACSPRSTPTRNASQGPRLDYAEARALFLERFGSAAARRKAGRRRPIPWRRACSGASQRTSSSRSTRDRDRPGHRRGRADRAGPGPPARSLRAVLDQRKLLEKRIQELLDERPLSKILTSLPGIGMRTGAPGPDRRRRCERVPTATTSSPTPDRPGNPQFQIIDTQRATLPPGQQAADTGVLPGRVRRARRPGFPGLLDKKITQANSIPRPCSV